MKMLVALLLAVCGYASAQTPSVHVESPEVAAFIKLQKSLIGQSLFDPSSAQYTDFIVFSHPSSSGPGYCWVGKVNAKNRYGGYVGARDFVDHDVSPGIDSGDLAGVNAVTQGMSACMKGGVAVYSE